MHESLASRAHQSFIIGVEDFATNTTRLELRDIDAPTTDLPVVALSEEENINLI